jgi:hypothetical protein
MGEETARSWHGPRVSRTKVRLPHTVSAAHVSKVASVLPEIMFQTPVPSYNYITMAQSF